MPTPVIVVHDDPDTRALATKTLRDAGYEVTAFASPMSVLDAMDSRNHAA
jgi:CheY-like chemotaxis protein